MAYSNSRRWESTETQKKNAFIRRYDARKRMFKELPKLDWMPQNLAQEEEHDADMRRAREALFETRRANLIILPVKPFRGREFHVPIIPDLNTRTEGEHPDYEGSYMARFGTLQTVPKSSVLCWDSIWDQSKDHALARRAVSSFDPVWECDLWGDNKPVWPSDAIEEAIVANWPCVQEWKYEGDDRIATDIKHLRFLPVPRKPGNPTVSWQQCSFNKQHDFDMVFCGSSQKKPTEEDVLMNHYEIGFDDDEEVVGRNCLGSGLMAELDPEGMFSAEKDF